MLRDVPTSQLQELRDGVASGRVRAPVSSLKLESLGLSALKTHGRQLSAMGNDGLLLLLEAVLAEREANNDPPELVWTGPEGALAAARSTEVVFRDILGEAQRSVWMAGYSIDHGEQLFAPLHRAMVERQVSVRFLLNLQYGPGERREKTIEAGAARKIHEFLKKQWPFEGPKPDLYYDRRTLERKSYASMHAKVVVVDERDVLIGSANFTQRGQQRNIEAGVLMHDPAFARQLATQLQSLIDGDHVRRYGDQP